MSRDKQNIKSSDWLTKGYSEEEIARIKAEAIEEAEAELRDKQIEEMASDLERYIRLNEDIAIKCKRENGDQNEEYWKGKLAAFRQIRGYIDIELKKKYTSEE